MTTITEEYSGQFTRIVQDYCPVDELEEWLNLITDILIDVQPEKSQKLREARCAFWKAQASARVARTAARLFKGK